MKLNTDFKPGRRRRAWRAWAPALILLGAAGCGDSPSLDTGDSNTGLYALLVGRSAPPPDVRDARDEGGEVLVCPRAELRPDAAHHIFYVPRQPADQKNIRFQATLTRTARECDFRPDYVAVKFGFAGRLLVGAAGGGGGEVVLPVVATFAGKGDAVVWTKTYRVPVTVPPNANSQFFVHVADDLVYQLRPGESLEDFRLYIGFEGPETGAAPTAGLR